MGCSVSSQLKDERGFPSNSKSHSGAAGDDGSGSGSGPTGGHEDAVSMEDLQARLFLPDGNLRPGIDPELAHDVLTMFRMTHPTSTVACPIFSLHDVSMTFNYPNTWDHEFKETRLCEEGPVVAVGVAVGDLSSLALCRVRVSLSELDEGMDLDQFFDQNVDALRRMGLNPSADLSLTIGGFNAKACDAQMSQDGDVLGRMVFIHVSKRVGASLHYVAHVKYFEAVYKHVQELIASLAITLAESS